MIPFATPFLAIQDTCTLFANINGYINSRRINLLHKFPLNQFTTTYKINVACC